MANMTSLKTFLSQTSIKSLVIRDNFTILESTIGLPITATTILTAASTERPLIEQSSKESASIEDVAVMEMTKKTPPKFSTNFPNQATRDESGNQ